MNATTMAQSTRRIDRSKRLRACAAALAAALSITSLSAAAYGAVGSAVIVTRADNRVQPFYEKDGFRWIVGTPGAEYAIRICNTTGGRVLAVTSVDGVNVVSGETASPAQSGYVLSPYECTDIYGWRKNLSSIAAFYFTELPDAYAARTGRPDNIGVIGVAFFRERPQPAAWRDQPGKIAAERNDSRVAPASPPAEPRVAAPPPALAAGAAKPLAESATSADASARSEAAQAQAPAPVPSLGTGHGRREASYVQTTRFERESVTPNEFVVIHYDRRENLVAMGILPPPAVARSTNPFPGWRFVPDPPQR